MYLRSLYLHHFRNYEETFIEFDSHLNLIYGANAQGKTTILEAIHCLMMGRSFRSSQSTDLIKQGMPSFYIEGLFVKHGIEQKLRITFDGKEREVIYNSTSLPSLSSLVGLIQGLVLTPDDVELVKGSPQHRRQFLDFQIAQADPLYIHHLIRYTRAMRQRNQLLKSKQTFTIESWEQEMGNSAAYIIMQRKKVTENLQEQSQILHPVLTGEKIPLRLIYKTYDYQEWTLHAIRQQLMNLFQKYRSREIGLGYTTVGPHKDDLTILIGEKDVRYFASEGQQRSCVTTLQLAGWHRLKEAASLLPLLMMDDVGLGLDSGRRERLLEQLPHFGQLFLTTTDQALLKGYKSPYQTFYVQEGTIDLRVSLQSTNLEN